MSRDSVFKFLPFILAILVYTIGMGVEVMEVDAAQYASMSMDLMDKDSWLVFFDKGKAYLDKPPLTFWCSAISFKLFGVSSFTYKLPSVLFSLLCIYSTAKFSALHYGKETGYITGIILMACQGMFLMNMDVKTDMYMIGSVMFAVWQLSAYLKNDRWINLIAGFTGIAFAMMGKGPIGLIAPILAIGGGILLQRDWKSLFKWQWLLAPIVILILLIPMMMGLVEQYGTKGLEFFFWTQSFGRITGESKWENAAGPFFLVHTFLWSFLPWSLLFIPALFGKIRHLFKARFNLKNQTEAFSISGFILIFLALSFSRFKLPHYIFLTLPFAAIITADWFSSLMEIDNPKRLKIISGIQIGLLMAIWIVAVFGANFIFPTLPWHIFTIAFLLLGVAIYFFVIADFSGIKLLLPSFLIMVCVNFLLNGYVYPKLLKYQPYDEAVTFAENKKIPLDRIYLFGVGGHSIHFHAGRIVRSFSEMAHLAQSAAISDITILTNKQNYDVLIEANQQPELLAAYPKYQIGKLKIKFLNPQTRAEAVDSVYLLHIPRKNWF